MPGPGQRDQAGRDARLLELGVELPDEVGRTRALVLDALDLRAQLEDPVLEPVLLRLQLVRRLDQRRPLLGRVADARALRGELGGDEEAEREQRDAEGDLPARDRAEASHRHPAASVALPATASHHRAPTDDHRDDDDDREDEDAGVRTG